MDASAVGIRRWLERGLLAMGIACLGYYGYHRVEAEHFQREQTAAFEERLAASAGPELPPAEPDLNDEAAEDNSAHPPTPVLAVLEIPRLKLTSPVIAGDGADTLDRAVGHLSDTPKPWESGNTAFAAHRDGLFRPLARIRVGDDVRVRTEHGEFTYRVRETKIVAPTDLSVLAPTSSPTLTLITCYPFNFIGSAPQRFVVHADRLE
jgi:sortase A